MMTPEMQPLYRPESYPQSVKDALGAMPPLATEIANRWMMGWPKRVKALLQADQFLPLLTEQEEAERRAYSNPGNKHLARHEIAEMYGLSNEAPML